MVAPPRDYHHGDRLDRAGERVGEQLTLLEELCEKHQLVSPYLSELVNPASVDLRLGREFVNLSDRDIPYQPIMVPDMHGTVWAKPGQRFEADRVGLRPGVALLATTLEKVVVPDRKISFISDRRADQSIQEWRDSWIEVPALVADVKLKSSAARAGLDHALAGWVDPGFQGTLTLEFHAHRPVELVAGKCYVQLCVSTMLAAPRKGYQQTGRYVGEHAQGAVLARDKKEER